MPTNTAKNLDKQIEFGDENLLRLFQDPHGDWAETVDEIWMNSRPFFIVYPKSFPSNQWTYLLPRYWDHLTGEQQAYWHQRLEKLRVKFPKYYAFFDIEEFLKRISFEW